MTNVALNAGSSKQGKQILLLLVQTGVAAKYLKRMQNPSNSYWAPTIQGTLPSSRDTKLNIIQVHALKDLQST